MTRKSYWGFFSKLVTGQVILLFLAIFSTFLLVSSSFKKLTLDQSKRQLKDTMFSIKHYLAEEKVEATHLCQFAHSKSLSRITILDQSGNIICDDKVNFEKLPSLINRPEIKQALKKGEGSDVRFSQTLNRDMLYMALHIKELASPIFLRLAIPLQDYQEALSKIQFSLFLILIPFFLFLTILSTWIGIKHEDNERGRAQKLRVDFVANVSHEVRTPLTGLKGHVQILRSYLSHTTSLPEKNKTKIFSFLQKIESNTDRLTILFRDILDLSVLENNQTLHPEVINVEDLTQSVLSSVEHAHPEKKIKITENYKLEQVEADAKILEQILKNLIENSYKYTPDNGTIDLNWNMQNGMASFSIKDTGIGIPEKDMTRIFERFYRVELSRSRKMGGTGLGLAIVKHGVQRHGGKVWVESEVGKGSKFTFQIPIEKVHST